MLIATVIAGASSAASDPWKPLYRPLHVPSLAQGAPCPVSKVAETIEFSAFGVGQGVGRGPVYPVGANVADGVLALAPARNYASKHWMGQKVGWFVHPRYRGPVLIRGRQLDGRWAVRFGRGSVPALHLRIAPADETEWAKGRADPSPTRLRAPGCYGYQVDGRTFSYVVVFRAVRA